MAEEGRDREKSFPQGRSSSSWQQKTLMRLKVKSSPTMGAGGEGKTWGNWALWFGTRGGIYLEGFCFVDVRHVLSQLLSEALDIIIK